MKNVVIFGYDIYQVNNVDIGRLIELRAKHDFSKGDKHLFDKLCNLENEIKKRSKLLGKAVYKA